MPPDVHWSLPNCGLRSWLHRRLWRIKSRSGSQTLPGQRPKSTSFMRYKTRSMKRKHVPARTRHAPHWRKRQRRIWRYGYATSQRISTPSTTSPVNLPTTRTRARRTLIPGRALERLPVGKIPYQNALLCDGWQASLSVPGRPTRAALGPAESVHLSGVHYASRPQRSHRYCLSLLLPSLRWRPLPLR